MSIKRCFEIACSCKSLERKIYTKNIGFKMLPPLLQRNTSGNEHAQIQWTQIFQFFFQKKLKILFCQLKIVFKMRFLQNSAKGQIQMLWYLSLFRGLLFIKVIQSKSIICQNQKRYQKQSANGVMCGKNDRFQERSFVHLNSQQMDRIRYKVKSTNIDCSTNYQKFQSAKGNWTQVSKQMQTNNDINRFVVLRLLPETPHIRVSFVKTLVAKNQSLRFRKHLTSGDAVHVIRPRFICYKGTQNHEIPLWLSERQYC